MSAGPGQTVEMDRNGEEGWARAIKGNKTKALPCIPADKTAAGRWCFYSLSLL